MSVYVEAPGPLPGSGRVVFLAGGITGCPDWQSEAAAALAGLDVIIANPRRPGAMAEDDAAGQIAWEFAALQRAEVIVFWFPGSDSVQPVTLYELGFHAAGRKRIAVGADPGYRRRLDVVQQLSHARPGLRVRSTLPATLDAARALL